MKYFLQVVTLISFSLISCKTTEQQKESKANHLVNESSPYLLQHAYNPVDWYPWGEEALQKAQEEDKLLIISIGYSACHWCHVMEHESFEDTTVARIMNEHFVAIKVDREERPDVDDVYMTACHLTTGGSCGWPLNAFALPNGQPFWAGTYFPKDQWTNILNEFIKMKEEDRDKIAYYAAQVTQGIQESDQLTQKVTGTLSFEEEALLPVINQFLGTIDFQKGGRAGSPKFPMPNNYQFLLAASQMFNNSKALEAVNITLTEMAKGGIYDHLGGGFARYAVDESWVVPHFEKMLYDNGQLVSLYAKAFQVTKNPLYKDITQQTLTFIERELTDPEGGFYSSLDADSEGEEGKFYVWKKSEIEEILQDELLIQRFCDYYEITEDGNWEAEKNILYRRKSPEEIAQQSNITLEELHQQINTAKVALFEARSKRIRPGLDDKILTSWNGLMLKGYVDGYYAFGNPAYLEAALKNGKFIIDNMLQKDGRLLRNYKDGKAVINGFLDDYGTTIQAFIALYQATFDQQWLDRAQQLADYTIAHFYDDESAMFNYTSDIDPPLIAKNMEITDNVIPSSNSIMANNLHQLGLFFYNQDYLDKAKQMLQNLQESVLTSKQPGFYSNWCNLYLQLTRPTYEVAIVGENYEPLRKSMLRNYHPNAILLGGAKEGTLELLENKLTEGETRIYVCQNKVCKLPVTEVEKALDLMEK